MADLQKYKASVCLTASGTLIHDRKVMLIKHKKIGTWLTPGGHIDPGEMPHQAAEREFWEETGLRVRAVILGFNPDHTSKKVEFLPTPLSANLHWISQENYYHRTENKPLSPETKKKWKRGCEQHLDYRFLVQPAGNLQYKQNVEETDGIGWFSLEEVNTTLDASDTVRLELVQAFEVWETWQETRKNSAKQ